MRRVVWTVLVMGFVATFAGCGSKPGSSRALDADVIVIGAGAAGLAAALEAAAGGASVLVIESNSVGGGHAVMAGGLAMVGTALQARLGIEDSAELAYQDWMSYGETNHPEWTRRYAEQSASQVYDWLTGLGVTFDLLLPSPENTVRRFHFAGGASVNVVVPMLRAAVASPAVTFAFNHELQSLMGEDEGIAGVVVRNLRSGDSKVLRSRAVVLATGGFQGQLERVLKHWAERQPAPARLLIGASRFATGTGHDAAVQVGGQMSNLDRQVIFLDGVPNPREPSRALKFTIRGGVWVNANGERFVAERASDKQRLAATLAQPGAVYWSILDQRGRASAMVRDAVWLNAEAIDEEIFGNPALVKSAGSLEELAADTGLPLEQLSTAVAGRLQGSVFYAVRLYLMTRKNMGGLAIDSQTRVVDGDDRPIPGLYAAGELTGIAGINGSHGMSGTFLGPAIFLGRIAGRNAATVVNTTPFAARLQSSPSVPGGGMQPQALADLVALGRPGFWHFETSHGLVLERGYNCSQCHETTQPWQMAQLETCTICH